MCSLWIGFTIFQVIKNKNKLNGCLLKLKGIFQNKIVNQA